MYKYLIVFIICGLLYLIFNFNKNDIDFKYNENSKIDTGLYVTKELNIFDKVVLFLKNVRHLPKGNRININADFTFYYKSCRKSTIGNWYILGDTLFLNEKKVISSRDTNTSIFLKKFKIINNESIVLIYNDSTWYEKLIHKKTNN